MSIVALETALDLMGYEPVTPIASDGTTLYPESWGQTLGYDQFGNLSYVQTTDPGTSIVYRQTMTYTDGALTSVGKWEPQP